MTRLICRAVLATTAALTVLVLHGQTTTAGLLDLDDLTAVVLDDSTTRPDPAPTPITGLLDRTTSILSPPIIDLGALVETLVPPLATIPLPLVPLGGRPAPGPPDDTDIGIPLPPVVAPVVPVPGPVPVPVPVPGPTPDPGTGGPVPIYDGDPPIVPIADPPIVPIADPGGPVDPGPAPNPEPPVDDPRPAITAPADDVHVPATGDPDRGWQSYGQGRPAGPGVRAPAASPVGAPANETDIDPTAIGGRTEEVDRSATNSPVSRSAEPDVAQPTQVEETDSWNPTAGGGGGFPTRALGVAVAAIAALSIVIAVVRRAINRRGQRADEAADREREPPGRVSAETRPPRRVPPVLASADARPPRVPPGRASADARSSRREPRSGVGGRPVDRAGRDRRVPRTPSARSARTNTQRASGARRQPRASDSTRRRPAVGGRASVTPPVRRTTG
jgi:hypothetical protein